MALLGRTSIDVLRADIGLRHNPHFMTTIERLAHNASQMALDANLLGLALTFSCKRLIATESFQVDLHLNRAMQSNAGCSVR